MSALVYPSLPGLKPDVVRTEEYRTDVFETISGLEQRTNWWSSPKFHFTLTYDVVRTETAAPSPFGAYSELGVLLYFFDQHLGTYDSFLFTDPYDGTERRVRFVQDSLAITRIVPGHWELSVELVTVF